LLPLLEIISVCKDFIGRNYSISNPCGVTRIALTRAISKLLVRESVWIKSDQQYKKHLLYSLLLFQFICTKRRRRMSMIKLVETLHEIGYAEYCFERGNNDDNE